MRFHTRGQRSGTPALLEASSLSSPAPSSSRPSFAIGGGNNVLAHQGWTRPIPNTSPLSQGWKRPRGRYPYWRNSPSGSCGVKSTPRYSPPYPERSASPEMELYLMNTAPAMSMGTPALSMPWRRPLGSPRAGTHPLSASTPAPCVGPHTPSITRSEAAARATQAARSLPLASVCCSSVQPGLAYSPDTSSLPWSCAAHAGTG
mmetsp:Transcript_28584/g.91095  ORF Transcript_28584/g.91095 Transcript_28584/m.91095 type:complete len:203 (-) Transcript_28584:467-1075(-)